MADSPIGDAEHYPIIDWDTERHWHTGDVLLQFRYFTAPMQDLDEAERGPVYSLTIERARQLREALDKALRSPLPKR
jgi:hypothetical protein